MNKDDIEKEIFLIKNSRTDIRVVGIIITTFAPEGDKIIRVTRQKGIYFLISRTNWQRISPVFGEPTHNHFAGLIGHIVGVPVYENDLMGFNLMYTEGYEP